MRVIRQKKTENGDFNYRKIEALYRKGLSNEEIVNRMDLPRFQTIEIIQKIFALDKMREEKGVQRKWQGK